VKQVFHLSDEEQVRSFSILERIDVGETTPLTALNFVSMAFSILERIDVGETMQTEGIMYGKFITFQYPRTDRRG